MSPSRLLIPVLVVACSSQAPTTRDSSRATPPDPKPGAGSATVASVPPPDAREVKLSAIVVKLIENGYPELTLVTPIGHETPGTPVPGRRSAA